MYTYLTSRSLYVRSPVLAERVEGERRKGEREGEKKGGVLVYDSHSIPSIPISQK